MSTTTLRKTHGLIASDRVEGTKVYNPEGEKLGSIDCVMLDKRRGNVAYALMSFGGFLGMGEEYHPLPWDTLTYDEDKDGYIISLSKDQLEKAPTLKRNESNRLSDEKFGKSVFDYYGATPYWF